MELSEKKKIVCEFIEAMKTNSISSCREMLDESVVSKIPRSVELMGFVPVVHGVDNVLKSRMEIRSTTHSRQMDFDIKAVVGEGEIVIAYLELQSTLNMGPYSNDYFFLFRFKNGKVVEWVASTDTAYLLQSLGYQIKKASP